jgi:hypothetical protein
VAPPRSTFMGATSSSSFDATVAQLAEQLIRNQQVEGSSPSGGWRTKPLPFLAVNRCESSSSAPPPAWERIRVNKSRNEEHRRQNAVKLIKARVAPLSSYLATCLVDGTVPKSVSRKSAPGCSRGLRCLGPTSRCRPRTTPSP